MVADKKFTVDVVNKEGVFRGGQKISDDPLGQINRPELDLLIQMLEALTVKRGDLASVKLDYLASLPPSAQQTLGGLQTAVADPKQLDAVMTGLQLPPVARGEFFSMAQDLAQKGESEHARLKQCRDWYGKADNPAADAGKIEAYKNGILAGRMRDEGYTFFLLKDEKGGLLGLASGNASKLASIELSDERKSDFRLLNVAVSMPRQGYGTALVEAVRDYAKQKGYAKVVVPQSMHAVIKGNPAIYASIAADQEQNVPGIAPPSMNAHPADALSIEQRIEPMLKWEKKVEGPRSGWVRAAGG